MSDQTRIDWCDATWNPWGWGCWGPQGTADNPQPCSYCYAKRLADRNLRKCPLCQQFIPHWHREELGKPFHWRRPRRIFVASMSDAFGDWVTDDQLDAVFDVMADCSWHTFYVLTKQAHNIMRRLYDGETATRFMHRRDLPDNVWIGVSVTCTADLPRIGLLRDAWPGHTFVSFEPLLAMNREPDLKGIEWVIIGGLSKGKTVIAPSPSDIAQIIHCADQNKIPVFIKANAQHSSHRQDWP